MTAQLDFFDQLSAFEGADVEYKSARGGLPGSVWETYSAFANTDGGTILLGVSQKDDHLEFHGVDDPDKLRSDFWSAVNNRGKVSLNLLSERDVQEVALGEHPRPLLVIRVPRADRRQRPVYIGPQPARRARTAAIMTATTGARPTRCAACSPTRVTRLSISVCCQA